MKKKYLKYFAFLTLPLLSTGLFVNDVRAEEKCVAKVDRLASIASLKVESLFNGGSHTYWKISVDGAIAMCADPTKHLNSGTLVKQDACSTTTRSKQALNYCYSAGCDDMKHRIIAQTYTWGGSLRSAAEAICSYNGVRKAGLERETCIKEESEGDTGLIYNTIAHSSASGNFTCWQNGNNQPVVTRTPEQCKAYECPPDTVEAGKDLTECVNGGKSYDKCVEEECGEEASCHGIKITLNGSLLPCNDNNTSSTSTFNEYFGEDDINSHDSMNGRKQDVNIGSGKYCALYCLETEANATLPGGLANSIQLGSAITWPTSPKTNTSKFGNRFPLYYHGKMECRLQVAPNLTYGNSCELKPKVEYAEYRKDLKKALEDNIDIKKAVQDANKRRSGHNSNGPDISTLKDLQGVDKKVYDEYLDKKNEEIRKKEIKTYEELIKAALANDGNGPDFFEKLRKAAANNETTAKSNYEAIWKKYQEDNRKEPEWSCTNNGTYDKEKDSCSAGSKNPSCPKDEDDVEMHYNSTEKKCEYWEYDIRTKKDTGNSGWWYDTIGYWTNAKNKLKDKNKKYNTYVKKLKITVDLYNEIYLCATVVPEIFESTCNGPECQFYNFETLASMSYTDEGEYGGSHSLDMEQAADYSCPGCSTPVDMYKPNEVLGNQNLGGSWIVLPDGQTYFEDKIKDIEKKEFNIDSGDVIYRLEDYLYNYIDKDTNKWEMSQPSGNYVTHGLSKSGEFLFSNLPTSFKNKVDKKYDLKIENIQLGHNGQFQAGAEGVSMNEYVCHYRVTSDDLNTPCTCPPGTKYAGMMLTAIIEDNDMTCADAIFEYCDRDSPGPDCEENCEIFCESDPTIEITACVNEGHTRSWCEKEFCSGNPPGGNPPGGGPKYYCPTDKGYKNGGMEITNCVISRVSKGSTLSEAQKYCEARLCNLDQLIIYRTIDLKNPFPSIDADEKTVANWPDVGAFNLAIHGRYPGSNWNSQKLVQSRIHTVKREGRTVQDNDIYKEKKPLYHFELDTATIKKIRQYNNKQKKEGGYNDNETLICNRTIGDDILGAGCKSAFVHNPIYGGDTTGAKSLCGNANSVTAVAKCLAGGGS